MAHPYDEQYWSRKENWRWGMFYVCSDDPRLIVPKRPRICGYTVNFGHAAAWWVLLGMAVIPMVPVLAVILCGIKSMAVLLSLIVIDLVLLLRYCHVKANPALKKTETS